MDVICNKAPNSAINNPLGERKSRTQETLTKMKMKSPFNRKAQLAFESAILALLVVGAMSFRGIAVSTESDRCLRHTHQALENLQSPLSTMLDLNLPKKHGD